MNVQKTYEEEANLVFENSTLFSHLTEDMILVKETQLQMKT